jgi:hypothetical protein
MLVDYRKEIALFAGVIAVMALLTEQNNVALWAGLVSGLNYICHKVGV